MNESVKLEEIIGEICDRKCLDEEFHCKKMANRWKRKRVPCVADRLDELEHHVGALLDRVAELEQRVFELEDDPPPIVPYDCPRDLHKCEAPLSRPDQGGAQIAGTGMYS